MEEHAAFISQVNAQDGGNSFLQNDGECLKLFDVISHKTITFIINAVWTLNVMGESSGKY